MIILITGGSGSGKSAYAEKRIIDIHNQDDDGGIFYVATMKIFGEEGQRKVERHKRMRDGKGFITIEQTVDINKCAECIPNKASKNKILVECMSNLVANEMFTDVDIKNEDETVEKVVGDIINLSNEIDTMVIVTNNVFEDGADYDVQTKAYIRALGKINVKLAALANEVIEVVAGIPVGTK